MIPHELIHQARKVWADFLPQIVVYRKNSFVLRMVRTIDANTFVELPPHEWEQHFETVAYHSCIRWYNTDSSNPRVGILSGKNYPYTFLGKLDGDGRLVVEHHNRFELVDCPGMNKGMRVLEKLPLHVDH